MTITRRIFTAGLASAAVWPVPATARIAPDALADARNRARDLQQLHSITVAVDGETVLAEAFRGPALDRPVNVKSVSKTLVATLTGAAIDRGVLPGVDTPVLPFLRAPAGLDPRAERITVGHCLTMSTGLERTSGANYGAWINSRDWVGYVLTRPFVDEPGRAMGYSTGDFHLLAAVLTRASGRGLLDLARDWLGDPLGIELPPWDRDPQGIYLGGNNMAMSPRGMIRFAEAIRTGGAPVVPRAWVETSWQPRVRSPFSGHDYGYGWFLAEMGGARTFYARGYGGQMIYIVPDRAMSVAITSNPNLPARSGGHVGDLNRIVGELLVPAARRV
jgi:CubicO group peptidase (beta-lactamase class C family)